MTFTAFKFTMVCGLQACSNYARDEALKEAKIFTRDLADKLPVLFKIRTKKYLKFQVHSVRLTRSIIYKKRVIRNDMMD